LHRFKNVDFCDQNLPVLGVFSVSFVDKARPYKNTFRYKTAANSIIAWQVAQSEKA